MYHIHAEMCIGNLLPLLRTRSGLLLPALVQGNELSHVISKMELLKLL